MKIFAENLSKVFLLNQCRICFIFAVYIVPISSGDRGRMMTLGL